ncbi:MAG: ABC-F family ATP-binding cassette domain-containing protein [Vallitaleaceae bacterium]|nr:ABC-F family ATP-binding cassette domain-containing protein [Vallitaleaceae bacterium]
MIELSVNDLTKYYGADKLFEHISFDVKTGERVGLIGPNGSGKTTIYRIIMGQEPYPEGNLAFRKGISIGYLDQMPNYEKGVTSMDVMHMAFLNLYDMRKELKKMEASFHEMAGKKLEKVLHSYGALMEQYEQLGGYDIDTNISKIATGLKIDEQMQSMSFEDLSGGEKTRVILAKILLESPDLLLLDEPSNHLDMDSIEWLEDFLKQYEGTVMIISHDRYFLDRVVTRIVELEFSKVNEYNGNYGYYVIEKERRFLIELKFYMNQQKKLKQMERQIERYRIWGVMRDSDKMFRKAKELEKRLEKVEKVDRPVIENKRIHLKVDNVKRSGKRVLEIRNLSKAFEEKQLFKHLGLEVLFQDSICILGANGSGKTTMIKILLGELEADAGEVKWGSNLNIGYLPQNVVFEDVTKSVIDYFSYKHDLPISQARQILAKVLFVNDEINKKINTLSGGEKSRLKLCSLMLDEVNCMILDEPTNHLDIESREVLEDILVAYEGTIIFVSHDRYFIMKLASKVTEIDNGGLIIYNGDYDYYRIEKQKTAESLTILSPQKVKKEVMIKTESSEKDRLRIQKKLIRTIEEMETAIDYEEEQLEAIKTQMRREADNYEVLSGLHIKKTDQEMALKKMIEAWEQLQIELEEVQDEGAK